MDGDAVNRLSHDALGTLLEAAMRDQAGIHDALESLKKAKNLMDHVRYDLPTSVADEVKNSIDGAALRAGNTLFKRFNDANEKAEMAKEAYIDAAKFSIWRIGLITFGLSIIGAATIGIVAHLMMPSASEIQALRDEKAQLEQDIKRLYQAGARSDFTQCIVDENVKRFCVRLDPEFGDYWDGYRIVKRKVTK
jgi:hypothetical protein